jgi:methanogenic corrinoid protein MtbC1
MLDFDEERFEKALNTAIMREGFEKAFVHVLLPLMQRTGVLWVSGSVKPSQEHFISNLIRRKLCVAVDNIFHDKEKPSKKFLLFLPEGETHELLLLFTEYILRKNNHQVAYIGSSLPSDDIPFVHRKFKPDVLLTYITVPLKSVTVQQFIDCLSETFPAIKIIVGGFQVSNESIKFSGNVEHIHSMEDLMRVM